MHKCGLIFIRNIVTIKTSMEKRLELTGQKRTIFGKKVKKLRREGLIPAHIYGKKIKSVHISVDGKTFLPVFEKVGETGLLDLAIDKQKPKTVLISQVQHHPITNELLHIDFHQVTLTEKIKAEIPIEVIGESPAVEEKKGILLTVLDEVEVEALPVDLPEKFSVDISSLIDVNDAVKAGDIKVGKKISVLTNPEEILVKIGALITKKAEEEIEVEKEEAAEAKVKEEAEEKAKEKKPDKEIKEEIETKPKEKFTPKEAS